MVNSYYSITVHSKNTFLTLSNEMSQTYSLLSSKILYFEYLISSHLPQNISFTLYNSSAPSTFLIFLLYSQSKSYPSVSKCAEKVAWRTIDNNQLSIYLESPKYMNLYMSIEGDNKNTAEFGLSCTNTDLITELKINTELYEKIEYPSVARIYKIALVGKGELRVYVTPCEGIQNIEIFSDKNPENIQFPDIIISKLVNGKIVAVINNAENIYYINISTVEYSQIYNRSCYEIIAFFSIKEEYCEIMPGNNGKIDVNNEESHRKIS